MLLAAPTGKGTQGKTFRLTGRPQAVGRGTKGNQFRLHCDRLPSWYGGPSEMKAHYGWSTSASCPLTSTPTKEIKLLNKQAKKEDSLHLEAKILDRLSTCWQENS